MALPGQGGRVRWQTAGLLRSLSRAATLPVFCVGLTLPVRSAAVCATVQLEVPQAVALERQAFEAVLRIRNGLVNMPLSSVSVDIRIRDLAGQAVAWTTDSDVTNATFFIRPDRLDGVSSLDGDGAVPAGGSAEARWLLIPSPGAGGTTGAAGVSYEVGARLSYRLAGERYEMDLIPDTITVLPMPDLGIDLFMPEWVAGDDPRTQRTEPSVRFPVGVRVSNRGAGAASAVSLQLGQPRIVDNVTGLRIAFELLGCDVDGGGQVASLAAAVGDIRPGATGVVRWWMTASLAGAFTGVEVAASHADELGGRLTALIREENVRALRLRKDVRVDLPGRDDRIDFLAVDGRLYESDGTDGVCTDGSALASLVLEGDAVTVSLVSTGGLLFACVPLPPDRWPAGSVAVRSAARVDGPRLCQENAWAEMRRSVLGTWEAWVGLFDAAAPAGPVRYRIQLSPAAVNQAPCFRPVSDVRARTGSETACRIEAVDPDGGVPCVTCGPLPAGAAYEPDAANVGWVRWVPSASQAGRYRLKFTATDGALDASLWVSVDVSSPGSERASMFLFR